MHTELPAQIATIGGAEKEDNWFTDEQDENWCADEEEDGEDLDGEAMPRRATHAIFFLFIKMVEEHLSIFFLFIKMARTFSFFSSRWSKLETRTLAKTHRFHC